MKKILSNEIFFFQKKILILIKNYIKINKKKINIPNSSICYFLNYGNVISSSYLRLKIYGYNYYFKFFLNLLKSIYSVIHVQNYKLVNLIKKKKYENLIISHVSKEDFLKNGSYQDKYFSINSAYFKNYLFFLISIDGYVPKKIENNIIIVKKKNNKINIFKLIIDFVLFLFKNKLSFSKIIHEFNFMSFFSNYISKYLLDITRYNKFKKILCLYEAQPYQNNFFSLLRQEKIDTDIIGFYHTGLLPLHSSLIYRDGAPDKLFISGEFQKNYLTKYLGWPKKRIISIISPRYTKHDLKTEKGEIFLPYEFSNKKIILNSLEEFISKHIKKPIFLFKIQNHPAKLYSKRHIDLKNNIKKIFNKYREKFDKKSKKISIFIGSTSSINLALENGREVIHICEDPIFDSFNNKIWNILKISRLSNNIFKYKLKYNKHIMNISKKTNLKILKKFFR